jgi:hypothetical protein
VSAITHLIVHLNVHSNVGFLKKMGKRKFLEFGHELERALDSAPICAFKCAPKLGGKWGRIGDWGRKFRGSL